MTFMEAAAGIVIYSLAWAILGLIAWLVLGEEEDIFYWLVGSIIIGMVVAFMASLIVESTKQERMHLLERQSQEQQHCK